MIINIAQPNNSNATSEQMVEFIKYVCEEVVSKQSVLKTKRGEHLESYEIEFIIKPVGGLTPRAADEATCLAKYHLALAEKGDTCCGICGQSLRR